MAKCEICNKRIKKSDRLCPVCQAWQVKINEQENQNKILTRCLTTALKELSKARCYIRQYEKGEDKNALKERQEPKGD